MGVNLKWLKTVKNFALGHNVTPAYIYKLVKEGRMQLVTVDGVNSLMPQYNKDIQ